MSEQTAGAIVSRAAADACRIGNKRGWRRFLRAIRQGEKGKYFRKKAIRQRCESMEAPEFEHYWTTAKFHGIIQCTTNGHFTVGLLLEAALEHA